MLALRPVVQPYAWGRRNGMTPHLGTEPTNGPEAELWVGTHPAAPALVEGTDQTLAEVIAADPIRYLGPTLAAKGVTELPFLLKVLAIGSPLSLQAHPSTDQAEAGHAREEAAGLALDDPRRTYRDDRAKPEALIALVDTWALCGFRTPENALALVHGLGIAELGPLDQHLRGDGGLRDGFAWLLRLDGDVRTALLEALDTVIPADPDAPIDPDDPAGEATTRAWIARLRAAFPDDATVLAPLLVDIVVIEAGAAVHLPAGNLHAYLDGAGVEIMTASDNVLRGGLTPKHIDVDELVDILNFAPGTPPPPERQAVPGGTRFDCGEDDFVLTLLDAAAEPVLHPTGPSLLLATDGPVTLRQDRGSDGEPAELVLDAGRAAFIGPDEAVVAVSGSGRLWWATVGESIDP